MYLKRRRLYRSSWTKLGRAKFAQLWNGFCFPGLQCRVCDAWHAMLVSSTTMYAGTWEPCSWVVSLDKYRVCTRNKAFLFSLLGACNTSFFYYCNILNYFDLIAIGFICNRLIKGKFPKFCCLQINNNKKLHNAIMLLPLSLHYINTLFSTSNIYFSPYYFSIADTDVGDIHSLSPKHQLNNYSQEWLDLTRIHMLKHCIARLQKVQLKLAILMKSKETVNKSWIHYASMGFGDNWIPLTKINILTCQQVPGLTQYHLK